MKNLLKSVACFAICSCLSSLTNAAEPSRKPNVFFIMSEDLTCVLGSYGDKQMKTPNIDKLTFRHAGRDFRLTDVHGKVVSEIIA